MAKKRNPAYPPMDVDQALDFSVPKGPGPRVESHPDKVDQYPQAYGTGELQGPTEMGTATQWGWVRRQSRWRRR